MYKIKSVTFKDHPILGNLHLDFCDLSGNAVDTVIIAGENGTGKSTVLDEIFKAVIQSSEVEMRMQIDIDGETVEHSFYKKFHNGTERIDFTDHRGLDTIQGAEKIREKYKFQAQYSDVDINFKGSDIQTVGANELDQKKRSQRSSPDLPTQIKQLIVDIQASDDADTAESVRKAKAEAKGIEAVVAGNRMDRFTDAFNKMFDGLTYTKVLNKEKRKAIVFTKNGQPVEIDALSSGEKQIVYRGCFLLKDINALNGAFVFIDEPEISLHPDWQKKILDYYKGIFTDENGTQTSQLFVVTHSPFIIHNEHRKNDKVIVLKRDQTEKIIVLDKPEYYICNSAEPIEDAFNIDDFSADTEKSVVYLEGRTDEKYFKKAAEVFGYTDLPFEFQWIGHLTDKGTEEFTGHDSIDYAIKFIKGRKPDKPQFFLYDCDTKRTESDENNIVIMTMQIFEGRTVMKKGIENALEINGINLEAFYTTHTKLKDYGEEVTTKQFEKMKMCDHICDELGNEEQKKILANLKPVIDRIIKRLGTDGGTQE